MSSFIDHYTKNDFLVKEGKMVIDENPVDSTENNSGIIVSVPSYTKKKDDKGDKFVTFEIALSRAGTQGWIVSYRYSELLKLHEKLEEEFPKDKIPHFPSKGNIFNNNDKDFLDNRRAKLEKYFQELMKDQKFSKSKHVLKFLHIDQPSLTDSGKVQLERTPSLESSEAMLSNSSGMESGARNNVVFTFPGVPYGLTVPSIIVLESGDETFIEPTMEHIRDCTYFFNMLQIELKNSKDLAAQFEIIERNHIKINQEIALLNQEMKLFQELLSDARVRNNVLLFQYLSVCLTSVRYLVDHSSTIEQKLMEQLSQEVEKTEIKRNPPPATPSILPSFSSDDAISISEKIAEKQKKLTEYEKSLQDLMTESFQAMGSDSDAVRKKMVHLAKEIEKDIQYCDAHHPHMEDVANKLQALFDFVGNNCFTMKQTTPSDQVEEFERMMYQLVEQATEIGKNDVETATKLRNKITSLMRTMASFKASLRKSDKMEEKLQQHLLGRLEDLQENLADFEHNFSTKYLFNKTLGEKAEEKYKTSKVEEASKAHSRLADEMFEL